MTGCILEESHEGVMDILDGAFICVEFRWSFRTSFLLYVQTGGRPKP